MLNAHNLFKDRLVGHLKELNRYLRYIVTGHIVIAMVFIVSAMSVYYQQFLEDIPSYFPSAWVISLVLGVVTTHSPIQTMLKKADIVFLIPAEHLLQGYFIRTLVYSYVAQIYLFILAIVAVAPLYAAAFANQETPAYGLLFIILIIIKAWSLVATGGCSASGIVLHVCWIKAFVLL